MLKFYLSSAMRAIVGEHAEVVRVAKKATIWHQKWPKTQALESTKYEEIWKGKTTAQKIRLLMFRLKTNLEK